MMKNEYFDVAEVLGMFTLICLIASFAAPTGLVLAMAFGVSAIISTVLGLIGGCNAE